MRPFHFGNDLPFKKDFFYSTAKLDSDFYLKITLFHQHIKAGKAAIRLQKAEKAAIRLQKAEKGFKDYKTDG